MPAKKPTRIGLWWIILRKEVIDNFRDRRTLTTLAISIIITPVLMFSLIWFTEKTVKEETDLVHGEPVVLPVVGADRAPNLMDWLRQNNIEIISPPLDPDKAIDSGEYRVILKIPKNYSDRMSQGKTAPLTLLHDSTISGLEKIGFNTVSRAISSYSKVLGSLRLSARGVDPSVINPIKINVSCASRPNINHDALPSYYVYYDWRYVFGY